MRHQIPGQVWLFYFKKVHGKIHKPDITGLSLGAIVATDFPQTTMYNS